MDGDAVLEQLVDRMGRVEEQLREVTKLLERLVRVEERNAAHDKEIAALQAKVAELQGQLATLQAAQSQTRGSMRWAEWGVMLLIGAAVGGLVRLLV